MEAGDKDIPGSMRVCSRGQTLDLGATAVSNTLHNLSVRLLRYPRSGKAPALAQQEMAAQPKGVRRMETITIPMSLYIQFTMKG
jgi:hypothetical protein